LKLKKLEGRRHPDDNHLTNATDQNIIQSGLWKAPVADIKSERWPASYWNAWPTSSELAHMTLLYGSHT
jgi:hypothetical protein